jgi:hypothetical protein
VREEEGREKRIDGGKDGEKEKPRGREGISQIVSKHSITTRSISLQLEVGSIKPHFTAPGADHVTRSDASTV